MWIIVLCVCFCVIFPNNSQEITSYEAQGATQTSYTNSDIQWNSSRPPVALSIRNGRNGKEDQIIPSNHELPLIYTNEWKPNIIRIPANRNRDTNNYENDNGRSADHLFTSTLLQRPDFRNNNTLYSEVRERKTFPGMSIPISPLQINSTLLSTGSNSQYTETVPNENDSRNLRNFQPFDLRRNAHSFNPSIVPLYNPSYFNSNDESPNNRTESKETFLNGEQKSTNTEPIASTTNEEIIKPLTGKNINVQQIMSAPLPPYRNQEFSPSLNPAYFSIYRNTHNFSPSVVPLYDPSYFNFNLNDEISKSRIESKELPLNEEQKTTIPESTAATTNEEIIKPLPDVRNRIPQTISAPLEPYGNQELFSPLNPGYFLPYAFPSLQRDTALRPMVSYLPYDQKFDRESGSEAYERIQEVPEKETLPQGITGKLPQNSPSETAARATPSEPLAFPVAGYPFQPFGLYPSPFMYPIPNIPQLGLPLSRASLSQPRSVQKESTIVDAFEPPSTVSQVLLQTTDNVTPEGGTSIITTPEENTEKAVPNEEEALTKIPYAFGFDMNDGKGNDQHRNEVSDISGTVTGNYGYTDVKGLYRLVEYIADKDGFRVFIRSNEPGIASSGSADVTVRAESPPLTAVAEATRKTEPQIIPDVDANGDLIAAGSIVDSK